jgi:hypothetical protein
MYNRTLRALLVAKANAAYMTELAELVPIQLLPPLQIQLVEPTVLPLQRSGDSASWEPIYVRVYGLPYFLSAASSSPHKRCRLQWEKAHTEIILKAIVVSDSEIVCIVEQRLAHVNLYAYLSVSIDGQAWSNTMPMRFVGQIDLVHVSPAVVEPRVPLAFNLTTHTTSYEHFLRLRQIRDAWCDFGMPGVLPLTPATFVHLEDPSKDALPLTNPGMNNSIMERVMLGAGIVMWTCPAPPRGLEPGIDVELSLVLDIDELTLPPLSVAPFEITVLSSLSAVKITPNVVVAGKVTVAEVQLEGDPRGLPPICRLEGCPEVEFTEGRFGAAAATASGGLACHLPEVLHVRGGSYGEAQCLLRMSLDNGGHWSSPALPLNILAKASVFATAPITTSPDMFCENCVMVDLVGSHFGYKGDVGGESYPRCWLGAREGTVLAVQNNLTSCIFSQDVPGKPLSQLGKSPLPSGRYAVSMAGPQTPPYAETALAVEYAGVPVISQVMPHVTYMIPNRRIHVRGAFPPRSAGELHFYARDCRSSTAYSDRGSHEQLARCL